MRAYEFIVESQTVGQNLPPMLQQAVNQIANKPVSTQSALALAKDELEEGIGKTTLASLATAVAMMASMSNASAANWSETAACAGQIAASGAVSVSIADSVPAGTPGVNMSDVKAFRVAGLKLIDTGNKLAMTARSKAINAGVPVEAMDKFATANLKSTDAYLRSDIRAVPDHIKTILQRCSAVLDDASIPVDQQVLKVQPNQAQTPKQSIQQPTQQAVPQQAPQQSDQVSQQTTAPQFYMQVASNESSTVANDIRRNLILSKMMNGSDVKIKKIDANNYSVLLGPFNSEDEAGNAFVQATRTGLVTQGKIVQGN